MRAYFAPCGIGLGHVGRNVPIARKLLEKKVHVTFSTYREGTSYIRQEKLPVVEAPPIGFQVKPDGTIDFKQTAVNPGPFISTFTLLKQVNAEIRFMASFEPDVVISDSRISPLLAARCLQIPRICVLNQFQVIIPRRRRLLRLARFADFITLALVGKMWTSGNTVLIPDFPPPYTICTGNLNIPKSYRKRVKLIGPILQTRPEELDSKERLRQELKLPIGKPTIFVPISGPRMERAFLTKIMKKILLEFPEDYEIVMSLGEPGATSKQFHQRNVTVYDWIPNRFEYLKACDLVVARAGHGTMTQCMCYGKPMILVPTPSHTEQLSNAAQAMKLGLAKIVLQEDLSKERLLKKVRQVFDEKMCERLERVQKEVAQYDGLENAVAAVLEVARR
ncbi:MAG: glycosyltransferase [Candidatus Bathyarchaeota archaeon]|jgi:UDP:flavonoid glycosyltransferase YjiC (YdhE family)|nr:glycosyltransferase [Candidatus Bathyarchaeota archaeon]